MRPERLIIRLQSRFVKILFRYIRRGFLGVLIGVCAGGIAALFLFLLRWATLTRVTHSHIIFFLPAAGLWVGFVYHTYGRPVLLGANLILDRIHAPSRRQVPLRMVPLVLVATILTHLFGGSAGAEGTLVQVSGALSDRLSSLFDIELGERKIFLMAGAGAGFGAALGTPWAGMLFGMEFVAIGRLKLFAVFECLVASWLAYCVTRGLRAPSFSYQMPQQVHYDLSTLIKVILFGCLCGILARLFTKLIHGFESFFKRVLRFPPLRPLLGGLLLVLLYWLEGSYTYAGVGSPVIQQALIVAAPIYVPWLKIFFTGITIGSGFKGGEFMPLVFIGTTFGSALAPFLKVSTPLLAALGFTAVFAGAANTPLACAVMGMELFGFRLGGYALLACLASYYCSGYRGIYRSQGFGAKRHFGALQRVCR